MPLIILPDNIQAGQRTSAAPVMANFAAVLGVVNGGIDADNVLSGAPSPQNSVGGISAGSSAALALADHQHILQGWERLSGDPTNLTQADIGRNYFDTTNNRVRLCISVDGSGVGTWVTTGNQSASDVVNHASRHMTGGADALPAGSIDQTMLTRPVTSGVMTGDVSLGSSGGAWHDLVTGVTPTVTGTQLLTMTAQIGGSNGHASNTPSVAFRIIDQTSTVVAGPTKAFMTNTTGNPGAAFSVCPTFYYTPSASPTLKLQGYADNGTITIQQTSTWGGSTGSATKLSVVVG